MDGGFYMIFYNTLSGTLIKTIIPEGPIEGLQVNLINFNPSTAVSAQYIPLNGSFLKRVFTTSFNPVWEAVPYSSFKIKFPVTLTTSNSAIATISNEGIINKISSGTVTINASNGEGQGASFLLDTSIGDANFIDYFVGFIPNYLSYEYNETLNFLIRSVNAANPNLTGPVLINEFTSYANNLNGTYVRNLSCWAAPLDFTGISVYNTRGGKGRNVTTITRRHVVNAAHYPLEIGDKVLFLTKDNEKIERTIIGKGPVNFEIFSPGLPSDCALYLLDSDLPETITQYKIWNYNEFLQKKSTIGNGLMTSPEAPAGFDFYPNPASYEDPFSKMLVVEDNKDIVLWRGAFPDEAKFTKIITGGDSGSPTFFALSGELFLSGLLFQSQRATNLNTLNVNQAISALDTEVGINTGYNIGIYSLSAFPTVCIF